MSAPDARSSARGTAHRIPGAGRLEEGFAKKVLILTKPRGALREVVICRLGGKLHALDTLCPHEGGRIDDGPLWEGRFVVCPLHLFKFDPRDGECDEIECEPATRYEVREVEGDAEVWLPSED
jgi:nitrite reductase/ring-hydroxylating ferredoxin subunit